MSEPGWLDVSVPVGRLRALTWGPDDGPVALCLHGFPDTAYGWRKVAPALVPRLWRSWSPGYPAAQDIRQVDAAIGAPERWRAAIGYYRANVRRTRPPAQYAELHRHWLSAPVPPTLYLHGGRRWMRHNGLRAKGAAHPAGGR